MTDRETLEHLALKACKAQDTYDLWDCIGDMSDANLRKVIQQGNRTIWRKLQQGAYT
jgi:hypothetical protein